MKNSPKRKSLKLLIIGLALIAVSQIAKHYIIDMPDFINGLTLGLGVGAIVTALITIKPKTAQ